MVYDEGAAGEDHPQRARGIETGIRHAREDIGLTGRARYAAQICSWRVQSGMTLRQIARAAGTSASRLSDYENAKVAPTTDVLARLQHAAATHTRPREAARWS